MRALAVCTCCCDVQISAIKVTVKLETTSVKQRRALQTKAQVDALFRTQDGGLFMPLRGQYRTAEYAHAGRTQWQAVICLQDDLTALESKFMPLPVHAKPGTPSWTAAAIRQACLIRFMSDGGASLDRQGQMWPANLATWRAGQQH